MSTVLTPGVLICWWYFNLFSYTLTPLITVHQTPAPSSPTANFPRHFLQDESPSILLSEACHHLVVSSWRLLTHKFPCKCSDSHNDDRHLEHVKTATKPEKQKACGKELAFIQRVEENILGGPHGSGHNAENWWRGPASSVSHTLIFYPRMFTTPLVHSSSLPPFLPLSWNCSFLPFLLTLFFPSFRRLILKERTSDVATKRTKLILGR